MKWWRRKREFEAEMGEELRDHLERQAAANLVAGMAPEEARRQARLQLGGVEGVKESCREERRGFWVETLWADVRYGFRVLRRSPGFTIVAVLTLALGIGANTAIFSVVNTVLLQSMPYPHSDRIVVIHRPDLGDEAEPIFIFLKENNSGFEDLSAYQSGIGMNLDTGDKPELIEATKASRNYFRLFGATPLLGRIFADEEDQPRGPRVAVISYGLWQRRFGGEASILGKTVRLGGAVYAVIGVLSPSFKANPPADVWIPLQPDRDSTNQAHILTVAGRLSRGITLAQARAQVGVIGRRYVASHPEQLGMDGLLRVTPMQQKITNDFRSPLWVLLGAVGLVLLMACANVANLLLARATTRRKEMAIRAALGAVRGRIVRQLLVDALLLSLCGGALGLAIGSWGVRALLLLAPGDLPRVEEMASIAALDPWVAGFTLLLAAITTVLSGLFPAIQFARGDLALSMKESSGQAGAAREHHRTRRILASTEVAIAVALLCGAVLLIRSFAAMHGVTLGFDPRNLLTMEVSLVGPGYSKSADVERLARQFVQRAERIPGVESAALANSLPLRGHQDIIFSIPGQPPLEGFKFNGDVQWRFVSPHYFQTLRIPLLSGRRLGEKESGETVVINEALAHKFWPNANPVGRSIVVGPGLGNLGEGVTEIVGVVGDVREQLDKDAPPTMYQSISQIPDAAMALINGLQSDAIIVRTRPGVAPLSVGDKVQDALLARDKLPPTRVGTMEQAILDSTQRQNFNLLVLTLFAVFALLLAAVGIYGVVSYNVEQRRHEIGIRAVLGANRCEILRLVMREALGMAAIGMVVGMVGATGLTRLLSSQLFGVRPTDPLTFASVSAILLLVAVTAASIPARRAMRVDPMVALRQE